MIDLYTIGLLASLNLSERVYKLFYPFIKKRESECLLTEALHGA